MTTNTTPWDEIGSPDTDYTVRLVEGAGAIPLYWGKDSAGNCIFIVELEGNHAERFRENVTSVHGIKVDLRIPDIGATGDQALVLTLERQVDKDLFFGLCETLIARLRETTDSATALAVALAHIKRWQRFLAGRRKRLLSAEEIRGLFGELVFLRYLYQNSLGESAAVDAWRGPDGSHQDFIFGNTSVEIKSLSGQERSTVRISSEDQLETLSDNLFLLVYRLSDLPESDQSLSLNGLVHLIENELTDAAAVEGLSKRLATYGYVELKQYDKPKLRVTARSAYHVTQGFPRLVRSALPDGIVRLSYEIELEKLEAFGCDPDKIGVD